MNDYLAENKKRIELEYVKRKEKHPKYGKFVNKTKKFVAHDETNMCDIGDVVEIMETRPLSKNKNWRLVNIIEKVK